MRYLVPVLSVQVSQMVVGREEESGVDRGGAVVVGEVYSTTAAEAATDYSVVQ